MQGSTGYTPKMLWPYSHEMARSYNGAWVRTACNMTHVDGIKGAVAIALPVC
jgi:hypothetical protein